MKGKAMTTPDEETMRSAPPATLDVPVCRALDQSIALRAAGDDTEGEPAGLGTMVGHFSMFDSPYEINSWMEGNFIERIAPGAFKRTIKNRSGETPIRVLLEHGFDPTVGDKPLGVPQVLEERDGGGYAETPLFDTSYNRDLAPALAAGAYGQSFRFQVLRDEWNDEPEPSDTNPRGIAERTIKEVRMIEFGPTVFPASPATNGTTGLRSTTDAFYERLRRRDPAAFEDAVSRSQALRIPKTPAAPVAGQPEDPPNRHSEDPPAPVVAHSEDPPAQHSAAASTTHDTPERNLPMENMTLEERAARQSEIRARLAEIDTEYAGSELSEEARSEFDTLSEEFDTHDRAIEDTKRRQERIRSIADNQGATERVRPTSSPGTTRRPENIYDLGELRQQARSVDDLPQLYRDNAMRAVEQARYPGATNRAEAQEHVERLLDTVDDDQGTLARKILVTGSPLYARAFGKFCKAQNTYGLTGEEQRALAVGAGATGGFAVPFQLDPTVILTNNGSVNPLRQISRVEQIVGKEWDGITSAGVTVTRVAEATQASDDAPTLAQPTVKAERVQGFIPFSLEADQDWNALQSEMTRLLADAKDIEEATSFVTGTGVSPQAGGIVQTLNASSNVVANTFTVGSIYDLDEALPDRFRDNASFLAHRAVYNDIRQFDTAGGANLWVRIGEGQPPELIGYPAYRSSAMDSTPAGTIGDRYLLLGDFRQFLIVDRVGMTVDVVPHLFGANQRPTGQRGLYAMWRNNSKILVDNAFRILHKAA
jgi:HK97 family phage major capsid protein/HK97 family phage prohead protease